MHRNIIILTILSLTISACGASPSIWGIAPTPTPNSSTQTAPLFDPFAVQDDPIIFPTSTPPSLIEAGISNTPTPDGAAPVIEPTYTASADAAPYLYYAQSGDMLSAIAKRFGVEESEITSDTDLTKTTLIDPGTLLVIPNKIYEATTPNIQLMPDAEIVFSVTAADFDIEGFVKVFCDQLMK
jgi:LysM repeat protein